MNFQSGSQQPFALIFDFSALLVDNLNSIAVYPNIQYLNSSMHLQFIDLNLSSKGRNGLSGTIDFKIFQGPDPHSHLASMTLAHIQITRKKGDAKFPVGLGPSNNHPFMEGHLL
jgi:hypothetical protein